MENQSIHDNKPLHVLRMKKPDQILNEVRHRKMAELADYDKNRTSDKKY